MVLLKIKVIKDVCYPQNAVEWRLNASKAALIYDQGCILNLMIFAVLNLMHQLSSFNEKLNREDIDMLLEGCNSIYIV